ncbi:MAG: hypothetical protein ABJB11_16150 [Ferruginibacter sp.]
MDKLSEIVNECHILFPQVYRDFYELCSFSIPDSFVGTDLINNHSYSDLNNGAVELLKENGIYNFLESDHFVFMMHQGYMFWYFKANGDSDPIVYGYYEGKFKPDTFGHFSDFVKQHTK